MLFSTKKSPRTDNFSLKGLNAAANVRPPGFTTWQKMTLSALFGAVLALSTPGLDQWWLAWLMVAPFLVLLTKCRSGYKAAMCGFLFGFGYHLIALRFYAGAQIQLDGQMQLSLFIWLLQSILLSLPTMAFAWLLNALPLRPGYIPYFQRPFFPYLITVPLLWIFLHRGLAIANPLTFIWQLAPLPPIAIDALPYSQYSQLAIIQISNWAGSFGLEFLILLVNAVIASFVLELIQVQDRPVERVDAISPRLGAVVDLAVTAIMVGLIYWAGCAKVINANFPDNIPLNPIPRNYLQTESDQPKIPAAVLSDDISGAKSDSYFFMLRSGAGSCELITLAEPVQLVGFVKVNNVLASLKTIVHQNHNTAIFSCIEQKGKDASRQDFVCGPQNNFQAQRDFYNASDYLPLDFLPIAFKEWFWVREENNFSPVTIEKINWGKIAILSGSEITNSHLVAKQIRRGASLIISQSNINWTTDKCLSKQLLAAAILRAVENNRYVILCATNAVAAIINPSGLVESLYINPADSRQPGYVEKSNMIFNTVQFLWSKTPFTKMWWL